MSYKSYAGRVKDEFKDKIVKQLTNMAADVVKQAKANANQAPPRHPQVQTGTLRRAITMEVDKEKIVAKVGIIRGKEGGDKALEYAAPLEFGGPRRPPYPYLFPAAELITRQARSYFR